MLKGIIASGFHPKVFVSVGFIMCFCLAIAMPRNVHGAQIRVAGVKATPPTVTIKTLQPAKKGPVACTAELTEATPALEEAAADLAQYEAQFEEALAEFFQQQTIGGKPRPPLRR